MILMILTLAVGIFFVKKTQDLCWGLLRNAELTAHRRGEDSWV